MTDTDKVLEWAARHEAAMQAVIALVRRPEHYTTSPLRGAVVCWYMIAGERLYVTQRTALLVASAEDGEGWQAPLSPKLKAALARLKRSSAKRKVAAEAK